MAISWEEGDIKVLGTMTKAELILLNTSLATMIYTDVINYPLVRTGRFRGNWHLSQGYERSGDNKGDTVDNPSPRPSEHAGFKARPYDKIFITNYTPYAGYIEYGSSKIQAHYVLTQAAERAYNAHGGV